MGILVASLAIRVTHHAFHGGRMGFDVAHDCSHGCHDAAIGAHAARLDGIHGCHDVTMDAQHGVDSLEDALHAFDEMPHGLLEMPSHDPE
jgi:hypothetical protein